MSPLIQQIVVDLVVAAAALWLVWSFGPESLRRWVGGMRRAKPAYDVALRAEGLAGEADHTHSAKCGPDCGCS